MLIFLTRAEKLNYLYDNLETSVTASVNLVILDSVWFAASGPASHLG